MSKEENNSNENISVFEYILTVIIIISFIFFVAMLLWSVWDYQEAIGKLMTSDAIIFFASMILLKISDEVNKKINE